MQTIRYEADSVLPYVMPKDMQPLVFRIGQRAPDAKRGSGTTSHDAHLQADLFDEDDIGDEADLAMEEVSAPKILPLSGTLHVIYADDAPGLTATYVDGVDEPCASTPLMLDPLIAAIEFRCDDDSAHVVYGNDGQPFVWRWDFSVPTASVQAQPLQDRLPVIAYGGEYRPGAPLTAIGPLYVVLQPKYEQTILKPVPFLSDDHVLIGADHPVYVGADGRTCGRSLLSHINFGAIVCEKCEDDVTFHYRSSAVIAYAPESGKLKIEFVLI
jgi:hypothetical protein